MNFHWKESPFVKFLKSPQSILICSFGAVIIIGTLMLLLPWAHKPGRVKWIDALFTATSAVCVTGLTVVDTAVDYTRFGQAIILILIQVGGLGVMTFASLAFQIMGRRLSLQTQAILHDSFFQRDIGAAFKKTFLTILALTFGLEGLGAFLLFLSLSSTMETGPAIFSSIFHSVSAFCNAGFSIRSDNLVGLRNDPLVMFVIMCLIVLGGLGYLVLLDLWTAVQRTWKEQSSLNRKHYSFHARVVLRVTIVLIIAGTILLLTFGLTSDEITLPEKIVNALFQSITARTAGFNTVDIGKLPPASLTILVMLMFIGGSPGSCAGGVKTTSMAIWIARLHAGLYGRREVRLLDRRLPHELISRTDILITLALVWNTIGILLLLNTETHMKVDAINLVFEQISAFGTVGLSTGLTSELSFAGKLWLIASMFVGRLGPLTIVLSVFPRSKANVHYPKGTVMIG